MEETAFHLSIQFPENSGPNEDEDEKNSFEIIHKSEAEDLLPVAVLLGWAGCQEKHLAKYAAIYEKKGFVTVKVIVPSQTLFFQAHKVGEVAEGLLTTLAEKGITTNPVIFHVFSNGGCMVYNQISAALSTPESPHYNKLLVRGVIFDSAPGKRRIKNAVKAFMSTLHLGLVFRYLLGFCLLVYLFVTRILLRLLPIDLGSGKGFQLYDSVCEDPLNCPQLFLFSKADEVVLAEDVEEVVETRKARGVTVKSLCWDDSKHVAHLREHPEVYTKTCLDFAAACLSSQDSAADNESKAKL